jgi:hypothetical protein
LQVGAKWPAKYQKSISGIECFLSFARVILQLLGLKTFAMFIQAHWTFENAKDGSPSSDQAILISRTPIDQEDQQH